MPPPPPGAMSQTYSTMYRPHIKSTLLCICKCAICLECDSTVSEHFDVINTNITCFEWFKRSHQFHIKRVPCKLFVFFQRFPSMATVLYCHINTFFLQVPFPSPFFVTVPVIDLLLLPPRKQFQNVFSIHMVSKIIIQTKTRTTADWFLKTSPKILNSIKTSPHPSPKTSSFPAS